MKTYLIFLFLFLTLQTFGQDWFPWHPGGEYYYSAGVDGQFWIIRQDSIDGDEYLLNSKLVGPGLSDCEDSLDFYWPVLHDYKFYYSGDSLIIDGESMHFVINHKAEVGSTWLNDGIGFTLESLDLITIFDDLDSVAVFTIQDDESGSVIDGDTIILSKNFGIIKMPSFNNRVLHNIRDINLNLLSYRQGLIEKGPQLPLFEDIMPLSLGDFLIFKRTRYWNSSPWIVTYYGRYYLSREMIDVDNIVLTYGFVKNDGGATEFLGQIHDTINRQFWEQIIYRDDRRYNYEPGRFDETIGVTPSPMLQWIDDITYQGTTNEKIVISWMMDRSETMEYLDTVDCWHSKLLTDYNRGYSYYSTLIGKYCEGFYSLSSTGYYWVNDCIVGYSIGGEEWGEQSVPTSITNNPQPEVQLFPNPANEFLYCLAGQWKTASYTIYSSNGQVVNAGQWYSEKELDIHSLPPGIYILQLHNDGHSMRASFVKR